MSDYTIIFVYQNVEWHLPVNPEELEITTVQANEKFEILKLGQVVIPTHMELMQYSFETELPHSVRHYSEMPDERDFRDSDNYLNKFKRWREKMVPVRFIASNGIGDDVNSLVLIEELTITEKAGEEGDKYVQFKLLEHKPFGKKPAIEITEITSSSYRKKTLSEAEAVSEKSNGYYVVQSGDSLWSIAKAMYGDGGKSNIIYNANKDKVKNPGVISVGWKLKIPTMDEFPKYSAPLPTMSTTTGTYSGAGRIKSDSNSGVAGAGRKKNDGSSGIVGAGRKMNSYEEGVAGISALLEKMYN